MELLLLKIVIVYYNNNVMEDFLLQNIKDIIIQRGFFTFIIGIIIFKKILQKGTRMGSLYLFSEGR